MGKYFGTDGFRGEANVNLLPEHAYRVGRFLGRYFRKEGQECRIVIGKDTRRSGYMLEYALSAGVTASGANAYLLHVTTTPSVSYIARSERFDCGIMISASHNPFYDHGIKLLNGKGEKMEQSVIDKIEAYLDSPEEELPRATKDQIGRTIDYTEGRNRYMGYLISQAVYSLRGLEIGLDCANGSAYLIAPGIFNALGAETHVMNAKPDGANINQNCGSTHLEGLQKFVVENHLDMGFAFDGDADRCLAVDEKGNIINGDLILYIYGRYMKERGKLLNNTIVTTVMSNLGLYKALDEIGVNYVQTAVGDKYVYEEMMNHGHRIGGEQSGHIIFSKYANTGDGILTALKLVQVVLDRKKTLSQLAEPVKIYPQVLKNIRVTDKTQAQNDPEVKAAVAKAAAELGDSGRILLRESGTEPLVRVMVEAESTETCERIVDEIIALIKARGYEA